MRYTRILPLLLIVVPSAAPGLAIYDLDFEAFLAPVGGQNAFPWVYDAPLGQVNPPRNRYSITNRLAWAQFHGDTPTVAMSVGNAHADATATETPPTPGFPLEGPHGTTNVSGWADATVVDPVSWALSEAYVENMRIRFSNIGSVDIWMDWELTMTWDVNVQVDDLVNEYAHAGYYLNVGTGAGTHNFSDFWMANDAEAGNMSVQFSVLIPARTIRTLEMDIFTFGYADSFRPDDPPPPPPPPPPPDYPPDEPYPVPEPATGVLLGMGVVAAVLRRGTPRP